MLKIRRRSDSRYREITFKLQNIQSTATRTNSDCFGKITINHDDAIKRWGETILFRQHLTRTTVEIS